MNSNGINEFFSTGDMLGTVLQDVFTNVNIYDDEIRLLQDVYQPHCQRRNQLLQILPDGHFDGGQRYVCTSDFCAAKFTGLRFHRTPVRTEDSTYAVKKCIMNLPKKTSVNFVNQLNIVQQYEQLPNGNWVLMDDDMLVDLALVKSTGNTGTTGDEIQQL